MQVFDEDKYLDSTIILKLLLGFSLEFIGVGFVYSENKKALEEKARTAGASSSANGSSGDGTGGSDGGGDGGGYGATGSTDS